MKTPMHYKITRFVDCNGRERDAVFVATRDFERLTGREYDARDDDAAMLRSALQAAGAPEWVSSPDGYVTDLGFYILRPEFTATISARPSDHLDPESKAYAGSVDAEIWQGDKNICDVTLVPREDGRPGLSTWGCPGNWCSNPEILGDHPEDVWIVANLIVGAVESALR